MTLQTTLSGKQIQLAKLFKVTYIDGTISYFTSFESDFVWSVDSNTYESIPIISDPSEKNTDLSVGEVAIILPRHSDYVNVEKLFYRVLDNAEIQIGWVDRTNHTNYGLRFIGEVGEVNYNNSTIEITVKNELNDFKKTIPKRVYTEGCDHTMYDALCGLSKTVLKVTGTAEAGSSITIINDSGRTETDDYFELGRITMTSGNNNGEKRLIKAYTTGVIEVLVYFPSAIQIGDTYEMIPHCKKTYDDCKDNYSNQLNYGGFQDIPSPEEAIL